METRIKENWEAIEAAEKLIQEKTGDPKAGFNATTFWLGGGRHLALPCLYRTKKGKKDNVEFTKSYKEIMVTAKFCPFTGKPLYKESETTPATEDLYYIQNRDAGYIGNSIVFWNKDSNSYTSKLENSKKFYYEEAKSICKNSVSKYVAWPCDYIDNNIGTSRVTDSQYLDKKNIVNFDI
jgi:hypothetical protein